MLIIGLARAMGAFLRGSDIIDRESCPEGDAEPIGPLGLKMGLESMDPTWRVLCAVL
jgi:hypothetical protein